MNSEVGQEAMALLLAALAPVQGWLEQQRQLADPHPVGRLARDDAATAPFQLSHSARAAVGTALDHLEAMRQLVEVAHLVPTWATFTLARAALENASTAVWLLASDDEQMRVRRQLKLTAKNEFDRAKAVALIDDPAGPAHLAQRLDRLADLARQAGVDPADIVAPRTIGFRAIVEQASAETKVVSDRLPALIWSLCSGLAHGQQWATLAVLDRQTVDDQGDVFTVSLTAPDTVLWAAFEVASRLTGEAWRLLERAGLRARGT